MQKPRWRVRSAPAACNLAAPPRRPRCFGSRLPPPPMRQLEQAAACEPACEPPGSPLPWLPPPPPPPQVTFLLILCLYFVQKLTRPAAPIS